MSLESTYACARGARALSHAIIASGSPGCKLLPSSVRGGATTARPAICAEHDRKAPGDRPVVHRHEDDRREQSEHL